MPNRFFEDGSEVVIQDFNSISKALQRELYDRLGYELIQRSENAFFGDSFLVSYASANSIIVKKGLGLQTDGTQTSPEPTIRPLYRAADVNRVISTPDNTNNRIDIVCVKNASVTELTGSRKVKDAISNVISSQTLIVQKDWEAEILIVAGTPNVSPVVPSTPAGYIKIANLLVTAVSGLSGGGAVTDTRALMPVGSLTTINTVGKQRVTAGAAVSISQLITDIDALLKNGNFEYFDMEDLEADPAAPLTADYHRLYMKEGIPYFRSTGGAITPLGSGGGGGGGGANWQPVAGLGPVEDYEYSEKVWDFEIGAAQALTLWVKVPSSYIAGRKISMKAAFYSPSTSNVWRFQTVAALVRKNNDAITSTANQNTQNSGDITNAVANRMNELSFDLTSSVGTINSLGVQAGDIIKVTLSRVTPSGTDDTADIRFIPSSTEVIVS